MPEKPAAPEEPALVKTKTMYKGPSWRDSRTTVRATLAALLLLALVLCFLMLRPFAGALLSAVVVAVVFHPVHLRVRRHVSNRTLAAGLSTAIILIGFLTPLVLLVVNLGRELHQMYTALAADLTTDHLAQFLDTPLAVLATWTGISVDQLIEALGERVRALSTFLLGQGVALVSVATGGIVKTFVAIAAFFFLLRDGDRLRSQAVALSPLGAERTEELLGAVQRMILASFYGVVAVAMAQGTLCGIGMWIAGLPSPALWGLAAAAASVVPFVGSALVWGPGVIVLLARGSAGAALFLLAWGAGLVATIDNVVRPLVVTSRLPLNPLLVFLSIVGGVYAFGVIGFLAGPLTLAVTAALLSILREEMGDAREPG
jgi:predicted PurR-regulated permease PerM